MKIRCFAIRDSATAAFMPPFCGPSNGWAIRGFADAVNNKSSASDVSKHPGDFILFYVGEFDDETGMVASVIPEQIARGADYVAVE